MLTEKQGRSLAKLSALPLTELSDKQVDKLQRLLQKKQAELSEKKRRPADEVTAVLTPEKKKTKKDPASEFVASEATAARPDVVEAPVSAASSRPCTDAGRWGQHGEWEYPPDREISCTLCKNSFTFSGKEQAYYAEKKLYAPARCPACIAAKREAKAAKQQAGRSGEGRCFNCGKPGHLSAQCPEPTQGGDGGSGSGRKACYVCGSEAHLSRNCPNAQGRKAASSKGCFTCGSMAHMSRECPQRPAPMCFNCGEEGHASKSCPRPVRADGEPCFAVAKGMCRRKQCPFAHSS